MPADQTEIISHFNGFDIGVLVVLGFFGLLGIVQGFTRLALVLSSWAGAGFITIYGLPHAKPYVREYITSTLLGDVLAAFGIFLVSLILFTLLSRLISELIKGSLLGGLDRSLGLVFGVGLGGLSIVLAFVFSVVIWKNPEKRPVMIQESRSLPYMVQGVTMLDGVLPKNMLSEKTLAILKGKKKIEKTAESLAKTLSAPVPLNPRAELEKQAESSR